MQQISSVFTITALIILCSINYVQSTTQKTLDPIEVQQAINYKAAFAAAGVSLNVPIIAVRLALSAQQQKQIGQEFYITATAAATLANAKSAVANSTLAQIQVAAEILDLCLFQANIAELKAHAAAVVPLTLQKSDENLEAANTLRNLTKQAKIFLVSNAERAALAIAFVQSECTADPSNLLKKFRLAEASLDNDASVLAASWGDALVTFVGTSRQAAFAATLTINTGNALAAKSGAINAATKALNTAVGFDYALQVAKQTAEQATAAAILANSIAQKAILDAISNLAGV